MNKLHWSRKVPSHVVWKIETVIEEDTKKHHKWEMTSHSLLQSRHLGTSTVLPTAISCPVVFFWIIDWNLFPFAGDYRFGKSQKLQGCTGAESPGWFDVSPNDAWMSVLSWRICQSPPFAHSCGLLSHPNSFHRGIFKLNAKSDADSLLYSLSHFECNGRTVHMLTRRRLLPPLTSTMKSSLFTQVYSSPLSLAARLHQRCANHSCIILTMVGFFPDRPHTHTQTFTMFGLLYSLLAFQNLSNWITAGRKNF